MMEFIWGFNCALFFIIKSASGLFLFGKLMGFFNLAIAILCVGLICLSTLSRVCCFMESKIYCSNLMRVI